MTPSFTATIVRLVGNAHILFPVHLMIEDMKLTPEFLPGGIFYD